MTLLPSNNHPFIDGNKRTAITGSAPFLRSNGYLLNTSQKEPENITLRLAVKKASFKDVVEWFRKYAEKM